MFASDQFGTSIATQPAFAWTVDAGGAGGVVSATGLYTAPASGTGAATIRATVSGQSSPSGTANVNVQSAQQGPIRINFQPSAAATVAGYGVDAGAVFGARTGGQTYGWNVNHADVTRDRNLNADQLLDTLVHFHAGGRWEIALPSGAYAVTVNVGDGGYASTHTLNVEGTNAWNTVALAKGVFQSKTLIVNVTDGRLTLDQGAAAEMATRINFVEITPEPAPAAAPAPAPLSAPVGGDSADDPDTSGSITSLVLGDTPET